MEVVNENVAMLSNFEVYNLLQTTRAKTKGNRSNGRSQNLATITYETSEYLSKAPCAQQSPEIVTKFMEAMTPYKLTKAEKLQILNLRPSKEVDLHLIVEEIDERFSEDEIRELLESICALLPDNSS